ncbi:hypothetical protein ACFOWX_07245 [Sphingorhabdus arenilitoris]|uniref:Uncharacterized protein n=1 Tax=Sphingorhabdus arenilitoris TaxID=1490041 RepID=A0ABV8RG70_9SPHN
MADTAQIADETEVRDFLRRHAELVSASILPLKLMVSADIWTLKQVQGDGVACD